MKLFGELYHRKMIRTWVRDRPEGWFLTSGAWSPFYFMFREVPFFPDLFQYSVRALSELVTELQAESRIDALVGVASTGIPLAAGVSLNLNTPLAFTRKISGVRTVADLDSTARQWGDHAMVEGQFRDGMNYLLVDDVVTGGASKSLARRQVEFEAEKRGIELHYVGTVVVVDRGFPGHQNDELKIRARHRFYDEVDQLLEFGGTHRETEVIRRYLERPEQFQDETARLSLCT